MTKTATGVVGSGGRLMNNTAWSIACEIWVGMKIQLDRESINFTRRGYIKLFKELISLG